MRNARWMLLVLALMFVFSTAYAQEDDGKEGLTEDTLDDMFKKKKVEKKEAAAQEQATKKPAEEKKPEQTFPPDERRISVTIKLVNGKTISGRVKNFLISERIKDHLVEPTWNLSDGPTVQHGMDEFIMDWSKISMLEYDKKNMENGEISCVEVSDVSMDRKECLMQFGYNAYAKDKKKKGAHKIKNKEMFRFVVATGKGDVKVDVHLAKVLIDNSRDESRDEKAMEAELKNLFKNRIKTMYFK